MAEVVEHGDDWEEASARVRQEVAERRRPVAEAVARRATLPGGKRRVAAERLAESGTDRRRVASARPLASGAGRCPGTTESGGNRQRGQTRQGSPGLRTTLLAAAPAAARCQPGSLAAQDPRLAARRGKKRAVGAVGHALLGVVYSVLTRGAKDRELGGNYFDERDKQALTRRLVQRLQKLGYDVSLQPAAIAA